MIILSAFFLYTTSYIFQYMTRRFALHFAFAFNMSKNARTIHNSQFIIHNYRIKTSLSGSGNPRAWTSVPGRFPSFLLYILFTETRELQHFRKHSFANLAVPLTCVALNLQYSASLRSPFTVFFRKEVFQPHLPVRLPCYDLAPITSFALGRSLR